MTILETRAIIIQLDGAEAVVEAKQGGGCGHCDSEKGCGKVSQLFCSQPRRFRVRNGINARIGDEVQVFVADGVLLRSAAIMYILPLALLLLGGSLGSHWADDASCRDGYAVIGAMLGLVMGFVLAKLSTLRQHALSDAQLVIARCGGTHHSF